MTTDNDFVRLIGGIGSPYTQKMVALLRYRRIRHTPIWEQPQIVCEKLGIEKPKPVLMPTFLFEEQGGIRAVCDSTPIIRRLEKQFADRSVLPVDPALAFVDYLLEDFADEWCTKYMFHYRWHFEWDADNAGTLLPLHFDVSMPRKQLEGFKDMFTDRQVNRLYVVGSNDTTAPIIDQSYRRFLNAMNKLLNARKYLFGSRPSAADFALYGQLTQLVGFDPTPRAIAEEISPRTVAWVDLLRDQSALEPEPEDWLSLEESADALADLLLEVGRTYAPAQHANAGAVLEGRETWSCQIDGETWTQPTFPYQAKCLQKTVELYQTLNEKDRGRVDRVLAGTGVEAMLISQ